MGLAHTCWRDRRGSRCVGFLAHTQAFAGFPIAVRGSRRESRGSSRRLFLGTRSSRHARAKRKSSICFARFGSYRRRHFPESRCHRQRAPERATAIPTSPESAHSPSPSRPFRQSSTAAAPTIFATLCGWPNHRREKARCRNCLPVEARRKEIILATSLATSASATFGAQLPGPERCGSSRAEQGVARVHCCEWRARQRKVRNRGCHIIGRRVRRSFG